MFFYRLMPNLTSLANFWLSYERSLKKSCWRKKMLERPGNLIFLIGLIMKYEKCRPIKMSNYYKEILRTARAAFCLSMLFNSSASFFEFWSARSIDTNSPFFTPNASPHWFARRLDSASRVFRSSSTSERTHNENALYFPLYISVLLLKMV